MSYVHFTTSERESLALLRGKLSISEIARIFGRSRSTIWRENKRNSDRQGFYSPSIADKRYKRRRKKCVRKKRLENPAVFGEICEKIAVKKWSPEQVVGRAKLEGKPCGAGVSTIYRAIWRGLLPKEAKKSLRHGGRRRKRRKIDDKRGKMKLGRPIEERPEECQTRREIGHFECDSVEGMKGGPLLSTHVDRTSRYLLCAKTTKKSADTARTMIELFAGLPVKTFTPDRGKEFALWEEVQAATGAEAFFPPAHHPWERGTNENTNGLLRQFFPKGCDFSAVSADEIERAVALLNGRPRKCLGFRTPAEVWVSRLLHLQ